jgi:hypothetical protein
MVSAVPSTPSVIVTGLYTGTKAATPDLILTKEDSLPVELMTDLIFEDIGGTELINISRHDLVSGQDVIYSPIKNLAEISKQYNPQNIISLQDSASAIFKNFAIKLEDFIPETGTGPNGEIVYLEADTGNIVINLVNVSKNEQIEVEILDSGTVLDGTIY